MPRASVPSNAKLFVANEGITYTPAIVLGRSVSLPGEISLQA